MIPVSSQHIHKLCFRMENSSAYFHEEEKDGLVKICRLAIHRKYPKYASDGYEALYSRPPVIYISAASRPGLGQYLCAQVYKISFSKSVGICFYLLGHCYLILCLAHPPVFQFLKK